MKEYRELLQVDVANTQCYERGLSTGRRQHAPLAKFFQMLIANKTDPRANAKRRRQSAEATELAVVQSSAKLCPAQQVWESQQLAIQSKHHQF